MSNTSLDRPDASMNVGELVELIRQTIREEFIALFGAIPNFSPHRASHGIVKT